MRIDKAEKFLNVAIFMASQFSKDLSTKVGCLIVDPDDYSVITIGYNGFPRGCNDEDPVKHQRPEKYLWTEHSERNAAYNLVRKEFKDGSIYMHEIPMMDDARALVSTGISQFFVKSMHVKHEEQEKTLALFRETGIIPVVREHHPAFDQINEEGAIILDVSGETLARGFWHRRFPEDPSNTSVEGPIRDAVSNYLDRKKILHGKAAVVTLMPCIDCASTLVKAGVTTIITQGPDNPELKARWEENFNMSKKYLDKHGVNLIVFDADRNVISSNTMTIKDNVGLSA